mgnify:CR=1 FL=1
MKINFGLLVPKSIGGGKLVYGNTYMYLLLNTQAICAAWILLQAVHCSLTLYQRGLIIFLQSKSCSG